MPVEEMSRMKFYGTAEAFNGTIKPVDPFQPEEDCKKIREAMQGIGTVLIKKF